MAKPVPFAEQNDILKGNSNDGVIDLQIYRDGYQTISCWQLSPSEMMEVMATGKIWLQVRGATHAPAMVTGEYPFEKVDN